MLRRVRRHPFPDFSAPIRPSDSLSFFGRRSGLPSLRGPPLARDFFCAVPSPAVPAERVPSGVRRVGALLSGAPTRVSSGRERVSQVTGSSPCCVPWSATPPVAPTTLPRFPSSVLLPSNLQTLSAPGKSLFRGCAHTARPLACLRIAETVASPVARLAFGLLGSALTDRVSHPRDG